ncbi:hypothetical protein SAMN02799616_01745 [Paenibacillus sp. UNC499MF]|nr:hypothetical protein SAMN02799616_01745 [Paenibacillus sp. UNC499MF]
MIFTFLLQIEHLFIKGISYPVHRDRLDAGKRLNGVKPILPLRAGFLR